MKSPPLVIASDWSSPPPSIGLSAALQNPKNQNTKRYQQRCDDEFAVAHHLCRLPSYYAAAPGVKNHNQREYGENTRADEQSKNRTSFLESRGPGLFASSPALSRIAFRELFREILEP